MSLNGANHDALCEKLGVDPSMQAVAVLLIGKADESTDATSSFLVLQQRMRQHCGVCTCIVTVNVSALW